MRKSPKLIKLQTKLGMYFAVLTVLITMLLFSLVLLISYRQANENYRRHLCNIVAITALELNGDDLAGLVAAQQETSPVYVRLKGRLDEIRNNAEYHIKSIYTLRFNADGKLVFVLESGTKPEEIFHIGDIYEQVDPQLLTRLSTLSRPTTDMEFKSDKWGTWLSAYAPIYNSDGQREAILRMDISSSSMITHRKEYISEIAGVFLMAFPLAVFFGGVIGRRLSKPIVKLRLAAEQMTQGNLDYKIDVRGRDEVSQLALSFHDMAIQLKTSINGLHKRAVLRQEVNVIQQSLLKMMPIEEKLTIVADSIVKVFDADFCRIWLIRPGDRCEQGCIHAQIKEGPYVCRSRDKCLHLLASSGCDTPQDRTRYNRVPLGCYKMGRIASGQEHKFLTNDIQNDPHIHDHQWARQLGLKSSAGYQLKVEGGQTLGVMALFSKQPIQDTEDVILDGISSSVALAVQEYWMAQSVRESEEKYRGLFENSRDAIMVVEPPTWKFTSCNQAAVELFRAGTMENFIKLAPWDISPEYQPDGSLSSQRVHGINEIVLQKGTHFFEWTHKRMDGQEFPAVVLLARMEKQGKVSIQSTVRDITEQKWAENELIKANQLLEDANKGLKELQGQIIQSEKMAAVGQLAAGVAHEMNNPIGFVASNFETLENYMGKFTKLITLYNELDEEIRKSQDIGLIAKDEAIDKARKELKIDFILEDIRPLFDESKEGLNRVTKIIQSLRDFSRIDQVTDICEFDLNEGIKDTLVVAKNEIKYDCDIKTEFSELPTILCNSGQINQVILNILVNAAQAIKSQNRGENGNIAIKTYKADENVICEIADDGPGIPPEILTKIFDPFFTTKPVGKGTGLGLSISRDIIVKHKGELIVDSIVDKGTKFTIKLPINAEFPEPNEELIEESIGDFT